MEEKRILVCEDEDAIRDLQIVNGKWSNGKWYDLCGRQVSVSSDASVPSVLPKGVYIVNGSKVVVR